MKNSCLFCFLNIPYIDLSVIHRLTLCQSYLACTVCRQQGYKKKLVFAIFFPQNLFLIIASKIVVQTFEKIVTLQFYKKKPEMALKYILTVSTIERFKIFIYTNIFSEIFGVQVAKHFLAIVAAPCPAYSPILDLSLLLCLQLCPQPSVVPVLNQFLPQPVSLPVGQP